MVAAGDELTEEQRKFEFVLGMPNRWLTLMQYLLDPPSIKTFMAQNCGNHVVEMGRTNERITAARWVRQDVATLAQKQPLRLCTDMGGEAWNEFHLCDSLLAPGSCSRIVSLFLIVYIIAM